MKRIRLVILLYVLILCDGSMSAYDLLMGNIYYNLDKANKTAEVAQSPEWNYSGDIVIPSKLTYKGITFIVSKIGDRAFENCIEIYSVDIPSSVSEIGKGAFYRCAHLSSISLPNTVRTVGELAFDGCESLKKPVYNKYVFSFLPRSYSGNYRIPDGIEIISGEAFCGCKQMTSVEIPNSVTYIGEMAFFNCECLTTISLPSELKTIETWAFACCRSLISISFPSNLQWIGRQAFTDCPKLSSVIIKSSNVIIDTGVFDDCESLSSITVANPNPPVILHDYLGDAKATIYVPIGCTSAYKDAKGWRRFEKIVEVDVSKDQSLK